MSHQAQQVIEHTLLPARHQNVVGVHVPASRFGDQVAVLNLPKYQISAPFPETRSGAEKTKRKSIPLSISSHHAPHHPLSHAPKWLIGSQIGPSRAPL